MLYYAPTHDIEEEFMRIFPVALMLISLAAFAADEPVVMTAAPKPKPKPAEVQFKNDDDRALYSYGYSIGSKIATFGLTANEIKQTLAGLKDGATGKAAPINTSLFMPRVNEILQARVAAKSAADSAPQKAKGKAYAEKFAKEDGVVEIPKGAGWMKTLKEGKGAQPAADDNVKVNYRGTLIDGTEFDSSYKRNEPATFPLGAVIPCWTNAVAQMKVGGKAKLVCPSDAAYGDQGHPPTIPGGSTLVFEVELLDVIKAGSTPAGADSKK